MKLKDGIFLNAVVALLFTGGIVIPVLAQQSSMQVQNVTTQDKLTHKDSVVQVAEDITKEIYTDVKRQTGMTPTESKEFFKYDEDTLTSDRAWLIKGLMDNTINDINRQQYIKETEAICDSLFSAYKQVKRREPELIANVMAPPPATTASCNPACDNIGFEDGTLSGWTACWAQNTSSGSFTNTTPSCSGPLGAVTQAALYNVTNTYQVSIAPTQTGATDPVGGFPTVAPGFGNYSVMVGDQQEWNLGVGIVKQTFTVTTANEEFYYAYAVVLENPSNSHPYYHQPYFSLSILDQNGNVIPQCGSYMAVSNGNTYGAGWQTDGEYFWLPWQYAFVSLKDYLGQCVTVVVKAADCSEGAHAGYAYFDSQCESRSIIMSSPAICQSPITLTAPAGAASYQWIAPGTGCMTPAAGNTQTITVSCPGQYSVVMQSQMGSACTDTISTVVTSSSSSPPVPDFTADTACAGNATQFVNLTSPTSASTVYYWDFNNDGVADDSSANPLYTFPAAGTYPVTLSAYDNGCGGDTTFNVVVNPAPTAGFTAPPVCQGTPTVFTDTSQGASSWSWDFGDGNTSTQQSPTHTYAACGSYTVSLTVGTTPCASTVTQTVIVNAIPVASFTVDTVCQGNANQFTDASTIGCSGTISTWSWDFGDGNTSSQQNPTHTYAASGAYNAQLAVTSNKGCVDTVVNPLTVDPSPTVTAAPSPSNICSGSSEMLTASGAASYSWSPSTGLSATTGSTVTANPISTTTYTVTGTSATGCSNTSTVTVNVDPPIVLTTSSTAASCEQSNGSASVSASGGNGNYSYLWSNNATTPSISNVAAGNYSVTVDDGTCSQTATVTVPNSPPPVANVSTLSNVKCNGGNDGALAVTVSGGTAPYSYSWNTSPAQVTDTATGLSAGSYNVNVTDANGCIVIASGNITEPPPLDTSTTASNVSCYGGNNGNASISVSGGIPGYTYAWTPAVSTTNTANNLAAGAYTLSVTDANGCSLNKIFTVNQPAPLTMSAAGFDVSCNGSCNGQAVVIPSGGTPAYHYLWTPGNGTTASFNNLCPGNYCLTITDANGCTADTCVDINQPAPMTLDTSSVAAHCMHSDGSATVTASGGNGGYIYSWNTTPVQTTSTASGLVPGQYCVTVSDADSCSASVCVNVSNLPGVIATLSSSTNDTCYGSCDGAAGVTASGGSAPYLYAWSSGGGAMANASNLCAGTYNCAVEDQNGCSDTVSVTITQPDSVIVDPAVPDTICIGQTTGLTATATGGDGIYTYSWTPTGPNNLDPTVTTSYTVIATDTKGCSSSPQSITLNVRPPLTINAIGDTTFCIGGTATLNAAATGGDGEYTYVWNPGSLNGTPVSVSPSTTTTYTVTVHDNCSTPPVKDSVTVNVNPLPAVMFDADTTAGCYPLCVTFTNNSTPQAVSAAWDFGDGATSDSVNTAYHCYTQSGLYTVSLSVTDGNGCSDSLTNNNMIDVYPKPHAAYSISPQPTTDINAMIYFTDESQDAVAWHWSFGDGDTLGLTTENPEHMYEDSGHYASSLIVYNQYGCSDTASHDVIIGPEFTFYVPNAFSPNGDGLNDYFSGKGVGIVEYQMWIFDRWGNQIFYTDNLGKQWDGKVQKGSSDQVVQEDVYVWLVELKDIFGKRHRYIGHVSVIK